MLCPKCKGKVTIKNTVTNSSNETYRKRKCLECGNVFYTCEFEVDNNEEFLEEFRAYNRLRQKLWRYKKNEKSFK